MRKLKVRQFGIGSVMKCPPLISSDSKYVFTVGDSCVYVWVVKTGEYLRSINHITNNADDHRPIVSIALNPSNRLQLCVGEQNGTVNVWDYEDGILIQTIKLEMELVDLHSIANLGLYVFAKTPKNAISLYRLDSTRHNSTPIVLLDKLPCSPKSISFDSKGEFCLFVNGEGTVVYLLGLPGNQLKCLPVTKQNLSYHDRITCAKIHPSDQSIALGTQSGRIALWYNVTHSSSKEPTISYLHWHSLPVLCLAFSADGSYLLSGGHECVLVKWLYRKSEPTFRPRLGAPIVHVAPSADQTFYASTHSDNTLHLVASNLSILQTIGGMNCIFLGQQSSLPAGIHRFQRQRSIVMNSGKPGHLQFISANNGKLLYNLDVVGENYVSPNDVNEQCLFTDIKRLAIDPTETWLATFEQRASNDDSDDHQSERKLRFWFFHEANNQFELKTTVLYPHGQETLNEMLFHPNKLELATTGNDGFIKIWSFVPQNPVTKRVAHWRCSSGHTHRSYPSAALSYYKLSTSEQIHLCASFEHLVTAWIDKAEDASDESRYEYSRCFAHFDRKNPVEHLIFNCDQLLVCHKTLANLWNCLNGQFIKSFAWHVHAVAKDPRSPFVALFEKSFVHFYSFSDGKCHSRKSSTFRRVTSAVYVPVEKSSPLLPLQHSKLIFYVEKQGLKAFVDDEDEDQLDQTALKENGDGAFLAKLIRQSQNTEPRLTKEEKKLDDLTQLNRTIGNLNKQFLATPAYLLPSIGDYCVDSLKRMLLPNDADAERQPEPDDDPPTENLSTMSIDSQQN